jgi:hypothetical protein
MTDLVERLRWKRVRGQGGFYNPDELCQEAADEIDRMREQVAALQASSGYEASIAQVEIDRLRELLRGTGASRYWEGRWRDEKAEIEWLRAAMQQIVQWAEAYPLDIFHEPSADECKRASKLLQDNGMTLDAFSASMGRHCLDGVKKIATDALSEEPPP